MNCRYDTKRARPPIFWCAGSLCTHEVLNVVWRQQRARGRDLVQRPQEIGGVILMLSYVCFGGALLDGDSPSPCTCSFLDNLDLDVEKESHDADEYQEQKVRDHDKHRRDRFVNSFPEGTADGRRPRRLVVVSSLFFPERRRRWKDWARTL